MTPLRGARLRRRVAWALTALVALLVGSEPLGPWLVRSRPLASPQAILALGSHEAERLPHAARLARRWPAAQVWLTEPVTATPFNCQDCANRVRTLGGLGVVAARVHVLAPKVRNTFDEVQAARAFAAQRGVGRVLVVTSPYHTRRVLGLLSSAGWLADTGVEPCPALDGLGWPWWSRRYDRRYVVYELAAMANNSWRYGIAPSHWFSAEPGRTAAL